jgi:hypothetical protein
MTSVVLPAINVTAVTSAYDPVPGLQFPAPNPGVINQANMFQRFTFYADGYWREMLMRLTAELEPALRDSELSFINENWTRDMTLVPLADHHICLNPQVSVLQALHHVAKGYTPQTVVKEATRMSGGVLTPVAALGHFLLGKGESVVTDLNNLGLNLSVTPIPQLEAEFSKASQGSSPVYIERVPYNTAQDSWITAAWLGNISLKLEGVLHKDGERLSFQGAAKAYHDIYDGNKSTHRDGLAESSTAVLDAVQRHLGATPYEIAIEGAQPISIQR